MDIRGVYVKKADSFINKGEALPINKVEFIQKVIVECFMLPILFVRGEEAVYEVFLQIAIYPSVVAVEKSFCIIHFLVKDNLQGIIAP
tara:strand:+ start:186 stop:449 length:264 start_codon:yes stop_codon:yes gene_type:complete